MGTCGELPPCVTYHEDVFWRMQPWVASSVHCTSWLWCHQEMSSYGTTMAWLQSNRPSALLLPFWRLDWGNKAMGDIMGKGGDCGNWVKARWGSKQTRAALIEGKRMVSRHNSKAECARHGDTGPDRVLNVGEWWRQSRRISGWAAHSWKTWVLKLALPSQL